jgi:hypothetical protein
MKGIDMKLVFTKKERHGFLFSKSVEPVRQKRSAPQNSRPWNLLIKFAKRSIAILSLFAGGAAAMASSVSYVPTSYQINSGVVQATQSDGHPVYNATFYPSTHTSLTFYPTNGGDWSNVSAFLLDIQAHLDDVLTITIKIDDASGVQYGGYTTLVPNQTKAIAIPFQLISPTTYGFYASPLVVRYLNSNVQQVDENYTTGKWISPSHVKSISILVQASQTVFMTFGQPQIQTGGAIPNVYTHIVDTFGQSTQSAWPEKVASVADMEAKDANETKQLRQWTATKEDVDAYGGINSLPIENKSKFYRTKKVNNRWWLVTPTGHAFFQLAIDGIDVQDSFVIVSNRQYMFENIDQLRATYPDQLTPLNATNGVDYFNYLGANLERKFGVTVSPSTGLPAYLDQFKARATWRLQAWRFNTVGWSSNKSFFEKPTLPFVFGIKLDHYFNGARVMGDTAHFGTMPDVFDPTFSAAATTMVQGIPKYLINQNYLVGYFIDNENPWGNSTSIGYKKYYALPVNALALSFNSSPSKRELFTELYRKYGGSYQKLAAAWGIQLTSWDQLQQPFTALPVNPPQAMLADFSTFLSNFAMRYFGTITTALRAYDPNHLILGTRFSHGEHPSEVMNACLNWCDAAGINNYAYNLDAATKTFIDSLNKPVLMSEFHFGSTDRGPFWPGIMNAGGESYRGACYASYVKTMAADPNVIGCDWYEYVDQPTAGEYPDLENGHIGFISVADVAYQDFAASVRQTNLNAANIHQKTTDTLGTK